MKTKVILIYRQDPLPYDGIASRTEIYRRYIESNDHQIDYIICPKPVKNFTGVHYSYYQPRTSRINFLNDSFEEKALYKSLKEIVNFNDKYIIKVIDDSGLLVKLNNVLKSKFNSNKFFVIYCLHGHQLNFSTIKTKAFNELVDLVVYLTYLSYTFNKKKHNILTPRAKVIENGIDTNKFKPVNDNQRGEIRNQLRINNNGTIFLWCAQDRAKKGIDLTLSFFKYIKKKYPSSILLIVGIERKIIQDGVIHIGKVPNNKLPKYYQVADVYLFTSLCFEGFPLSLTEAIKSGCYCIASDYGGVEEVLGFGKYGRLIRRPHFIDDWVQAIDEYFKKPIKFDTIPKNKYSSNRWNNEMNQLLIELKEELSYE